MNKWQSLAQIIEKIKQPGLIASFIKKAGIVFVIQVIGSALSYILQVFLARVMGHGEYGLYTYILAWVTIGAIFCNLGLPGAILRFVPKYITQGDWGRFQGVIRGASKFTFAVSIVGALLGTILAFSLHAYGRLENFNFIPVLLGIWTLPLIALENIQRSLFRGCRQMVSAYGPSNVLRPLLLMVIAAAIFVWQGKPLSSKTLFIITLASYVILISTQQILIHNRLLTQGKLEQPIYELRSWLRVSLPLLLIVGSVIILYQTDVLMIGALLEPTQVGLYNAATKTSNLTTFVYTAVEAIAAPTISSLYVAGDRHQMQKVVTTMANLVFWPTIAVTLFIVIFSNQILGMFGSEFVVARSSLIILMLGQLVNATTGPVGYLLDLTGHQDQSARVRFCTAFLNIVLNLIFIPLFGIMGAAMATAIAVIIDNTVIYFLAVKYVGVHASIFSLFTLRSVKNK